MNDDLKDLLARIPDVQKALGRIPGTVDRLRRAHGAPSQIWRADDQADVTTKIICSGLQLEIEELRERLDEIEEKAAIARAAERNWRPMLQAKNSLVFCNDCGETATMPLDLVRLIASKGSVDAEVVEDDDLIVFQRGDEELAQIPKTLFVTLEKILERCPWNLGKAKAPRSQSRDSQPT